MSTVVPSRLGIVLAFVVAATVGSMLAAWVWYAEQRIRGRRVFPDRPTGPRFVPWGLTEITIVIVAFVAFSGLIPLAYVLATGRPVRPAASKTDALKTTVSSAKAVAKATDPVSERPPLPFRTLLLLNLVVNASLLVTVPLVVSALSRATWLDLGVKAEGFGASVQYGVVAFLLVTPLVMVVNLAAIRLWHRSAHPVETMLREKLTPSAVLVAYLAAAVFAPLSEELIFRGLLQAWLRKVFLAKPELNPFTDEIDSRYDLPLEPTVAPRLVPRIPFLADRFRLPHTLPAFAPVVITSLVFAALHYQQMPAPIPIFALSLALGALYERTGSLVSSVALHSLFNTFNTTVLLTALTLFPDKFGS